MIKTVKKTKKAARKISFFYFFHLISFYFIIAKPKSI